MLINALSSLFVCTVHVVYKHKKSVTWYISDQFTFCTFT